MNIDKKLIEDVLYNLDFKLVEYSNNYKIYSKILKFYNDTLEIKIDNNNEILFSIVLNDNTIVFTGKTEKISNIEEFKKVIDRLVNFSNDFTIYYF